MTEVLPSSRAPAWRCLRCGLVSNGPRAKHRRWDHTINKVIGPCGELQAGYFVPTVENIDKER